MYVGFVKNPMIFEEEVLTIKVTLIPSEATQFEGKKHRRKV